MSADNWAVCPRCIRRRERHIAQMTSDVTASYGVVPIDKWEALKADLAKAIGTSLEPTLREDYDITGADEGAVCVSYSGHCGACGLSLSFIHEVAFDGVDG